MPLRQVVVVVVVVVAVVVVVVVFCFLALCRREKRQLLQNASFLTRPYRQNAFELQISAESFGMDGSFNFTVGPCENLSSEALNSKFSRFYQNQAELALCWIFPTTGSWKTATFADNSLKAVG